MRHGCCVLRPLLDCLPLMTHSVKHDCRYKRAQRIRHHRKGTSRLLGLTTCVSCNSYYTVQYGKWSALFRLFNQHREAWLLARGAK
eukprot:1325195-Pleurochrysis_carterae.AAC.1